jgi:hypothetical protein
VAHLAEGLGEVVGCIAVIFNDEKSHDVPVEMCRLNPIDLAAAGTSASAPFYVDLSIPTKF